MSSHDHNALLSLYGTPRAVIRKRVSARAKIAPPVREEDDPEKLGSSIVNLTCLKDHETTSR